MIVRWMLSTVVFAACLALAGVAAEHVVRALGRQARLVWIGVLGAATLWPVILPLARRALPRVEGAVAGLPTVRIVSDAGWIIDLSSGGADPMVERLLLSLWALATLALGLRLATGLFALRRLRSTAEARVLDGAPVLISETVGPATIGLRDRAVVLPRSILDLDEPLRRLVLRHECEHCDARDPWLLLGAGVAVVLFPWNAPLWWIARRMHLALEIDCDARVLASGADVAHYGALLLWMAQRRQAIPLAPMLAAPLSHLERRIIAMRDRSRRPRPMHLAVAVLTAIVATMAACSASVTDDPTTRRPRGEPVSVTAPSSRAYFEYQVETPARQLPKTGMLRYPADMRLANREGEVLAQFVVNREGVVELDTFKAIKSSDPAFSAAVRSALPSMRFSPARVGGAVVPQLVQQPFTFALSRS
jgi:TonB family protein